MNINQNEKISDLVERIKRLENHLQKTVHVGIRYFSKLPIQNLSKTEFIPIDEVYSIEADGRYAHVHLLNSSRFINYSLKDLESRLNPNKFIRVHKSWIISIEHVQVLENCGVSFQVASLENGQKIRLSRRYKYNLKTLFEQANDVVLV